MNLNRRLSISRKMSRLSQSEHVNLMGLARDLFEQCPKKYEVLGPTNLEVKGIKISSFSNEQDNVQKNSLIKDWNEINEITKNFGSPELSDLTSGNIYNRASIYEDKCSQAYRIADLIPYFNSDEIIYCLEQSYNWPLKSVQESDTLTDILKSIDKTCYNNIRQSKTLNEQTLIRTAYLISLNLLKLKEPILYLPYFIEHYCNSISSVKLHDNNPIVFLLLAAFNNRPVSDINFVKELSNYASNNFESLSAVELAVSYSGLIAISEDKNSMVDFKNRIAAKYGFRL